MVVLALLDPTGVSAFLVEVFGLGALLRYALALPSERCHESEADDLGLDIAAGACYDPNLAAGFFEKLAALEGALPGMAWASDHPPSGDRFQAMRARAGQAQAEARCGGPRADLAQASGGIWGRLWGQAK